MRKFLIWSNQHCSWWRAHERGYTQRIEEAGRYDRADAERIVSNATLDGRLATDTTDLVTGRPYSRLDEYMVVAPEDTPGHG